MAKFRAAVVQDGTSRQGTSTTLEKAEALIAQCGSRGANVAVFPEAFIGGYPKGADFHIYLGARTAAGRDDFLAYYNESIVVPGAETERLGMAAKGCGSLSRHRRDRARRRHTVLQRALFRAERRSSGKTPQTYADGIGAAVLGIRRWIHHARR